MKFVSKICLFVLFLMAGISVQGMDGVFRFVDKYVMPLTVSAPLLLQDPYERKIKTRENFLTAQQKEILVDHVQEIVDKLPYAKYDPYFHQLLPGFVVKNGHVGLGRTAGAKKIRKIIEQHELDLLLVPKKEDFNISYKNKEGNDSCLKLVICEKINGKEFEKINLDQLKQLIILTRYTGYLDYHPGNILMTPEGKLAIIDTEAKSFLSCQHDYLYRPNKRLNKLDFLPEAYRYLVSLNAEVIRSNC